MASARVLPLPRSRQKANRREAILSAAEGLIRETGSTEFSVAMLAERAGISIATLYNLIGSKGTVLYSLLNRSMDLLDSLEIQPNKTSNAFEQAVAAADAVAEVFIKDPLFFRPLYRFLLGVIEPTHRPAFMNRALAYWKTRLAGLAREKRLPPGVTLDSLAREYRIYFAGALDLWVQGELGDEHFRAQIRYGCLIRLLALGDLGARPALLKDLQKTNRAVAKFCRLEANALPLAIRDRSATAAS